MAPVELGDVFGWFGLGGVRESGWSFSGRTPLYQDIASRPASFGLRESENGMVGWIDELSQLAQQGGFQAGLLAICILWALFTLLEKGDGDQPAGIRTAKSIPRLELASNAARVVAFALLVYASLKGQGRWLDAALVGYSVLVGWVRLVPRRVARPKVRRLALHQTNIITVEMLLALFTTEILPLVVVGSDHRPDRATFGAAALLLFAVLLAAATPREWSPSPRDARPTVSGDVERAPTPEETCSWFSYYMSFGWISPLIWTGYRNTVGMADLPGLPWYDDPKHLLARILTARQANHGKTLWTLVQFGRKELVDMSLFVGISFAADLVAPYGLYQLLAYLAAPEKAILHPALWLFLMFAGPLVRSVTLQQYSFVSARLEVRVKAALTAELYHTALVSRELEDDVVADISAGKSPASQSTAAGQLANLMSSDINTITGANNVVMVAIGVPVGVLLALTGLYKIVGWSSLVGLLLLIVCFPLPALIVRNVGAEQEEVKAAQDSRISLASEYLGAIRVVKYFAWEDVVAEQIGKVRDKELKHLWKIGVLYSVMGEVTEFIPVLALLAIFSIFVGVLGEPLTAPVAFTTVSLLTIIRKNLFLIGAMSSRVTNAAISMRRLDKYFAATKPLESFPEGPLKIQNGVFRRNQAAVFSLKDLSIDFVQNGLNVVTGQSGSGKTTLLLSILGETIKEHGTVTRPKDVAYVSQTPWIQAQSVRENILFNNPFDMERYRRVVDACCLSSDFEELLHGDETEVGDNGAALSGGQRARVALARALYSEAPLLLLDDIFTAIDSKTASTLWKLVFCSEMLKHRTVVLVTQLQWISAQADLAITLQDGTVGSTEQNLGVTRKPINIDTISSEREETNPENGRSMATSSNTEVRENGGGGAGDAEEAEIEDEMAISGVSSRLMLFKYMVYFGGPSMAVLSLIAIILINIPMLATTLWLSHWVDSPTDGRIAFYLGIYTAISLSGALVTGAASLFFARCAWRAARTLHSALVRAVLRAPLAWYARQASAVARVLNRLSHDVDVLDSTAGAQAVAFLGDVVRMLLAVAAVGSVFPVFLLPALAVCVVGIACGEMYSRTATAVRRLMAASQSPVLAHFADSLAGLAVLRAGGGGAARFEAGLVARLRAAARAAEAYYHCHCWLRLRIDFITALVGVCAGWIAVTKAGVLAAGLVGFSLTNSTGLSQAVLNVVRQMNDLEVELQSFHRVEEYTKIPPEEVADEVKNDAGVQEYGDENERVVPANWPSSGRVEFRAVTIRWDPDGPDILKEINLVFEAGERVAIVGRTGSGKSTLVLSLLRFTHITKGRILYAGRDITTTPRPTLRRATTIIPQEALLFHGTVASNLDPTHTLPRPALQAALARCAAVPVLRQQALDLDSPVAAGGANFSHGQRQVLSLARALAKRGAPLMLLDEATASMDAATDADVQAVLRAEAEGGEEGRTWVTIAHRLRTIVDYDKVVVMGGGRVLEVGSPTELFEKESGAFRELVAHSGEEDMFGDLI